MNNKFRGLSAFLVLMMALSIQAQIVINEVDAETPGSDVLEFVELFGPPNESLDGLVLVDFNGSDLQRNNLAVDLDGHSLDANGLFVIGNSGVANVGLIIPDGSLQNGADAVALYNGDDTDFPANTPVTATNIIDALVYDTNDADIAGLIDVLTPGQAQIDENGGGDDEAHSNSRFPDGGTALVTSTYVQQAPTPGAFNAPRFSIDDVTQVEGNAGTTTFNFTVSIDVAANATVRYSTSDGTATVTDSDYNPINGNAAKTSEKGGTIPTLTFTAAGATSQTVSVTVNGDTTIEGDETFFVNLSNATGASIADAQGVGTITNDDFAPLLVNVVTTDETSPGANDGTATATATGGVGPYTYAWSNGATTPTVTGLVPGSYTVTVTDSNAMPASVMAPVVIVAGVPPAIIPTLNQYMIMLLMLLMGFVVARRIKV